MIAALATLAAVIVGAVFAALATVSLVFWFERDYRKTRRATQNVLGGRQQPPAEDCPAQPPYNAQETPVAAERPNHTAALADAAHSLGSAGRPAIYRYAAERIFGADGTPQIDLLPPAPEPATPREWNEIAVDAIAKLEHMRNVASQYKSLAETLEASLYAARQDAEQQRNRADQLQALYVRRTQQALRAGCRIVIDHGDPDQRSK